MRRWVWWALLAGCGADDGGPAADPTPTGATTEVATTDAPEPATTTTTGPVGTTTGPSDDSSTGADLPQPGPYEVIEAFSGTHVYFGDENMRQIDVEVDFPPAELTYASIQLGIVLGCPNESCDWWDRKGFIGVVHDAGTDEETVTELARFITPYRVGATWVVDVTALRPLLTGPQTLRLFIDTWVGPGHANGDGWLVDASFELDGGEPLTEIPVEVVDLWPQMAFEYGNPENPVDSSVPPAIVDIPADASRVQLRSLITGHGQGNLDNCAEFCPRTHGFSVDDTVVSREVWRDDCDQTPVQGQQGTWTLPRAGWCPGAEVLPWVEDVTDAVTPGRAATVAYDVEPYENSCSPQSPQCMGCALGTGCEYDGGNHTPPEYRFGAQLIIYRALAGG